MTESRRSRTRTAGHHARRSAGRTRTKPPDPGAGPGTSAFAAGERLANRYRIQRLLGRGGMGVVYEAVDEELSIPVALKTLGLDLVGDREALLRLKREVLLARSVAHPNVCRVYDLGRHDGRGGPVWFLSMELLRGETLRERMRSRGRLAAAEVLPLAEQMAAALGAAHRAGVVHRDFNSANVMLVHAAEADRVVVTDFGIARALVASAAGPETALTGTGLIGTFASMAPEQLRGEPVGPAADIYALGLVLYEMVTGTVPFPGSVVEAASRRLNEDAPPPRRVARDLEPRWEAVILRCLAREPNRRFARAEDVADTLAGRATLTSGRVPGSWRVPRHALPEEQDAFVGRDVELEAIDRWLGGVTRVLTLLGAGGMGKTRLAVRYGWRSRERWPGGVWFCDLADARSRDGIAAAVAGTLGVPPGKGDPSDQVGHAIAGRGRCLLILDNFEQLVRHAADTVGAWTRAAAEATFLVTSRERLNLRGEQTQLIEPLSIESGVELFAERARSQRPGLELPGQELESVREVVRLVDAIPLAIELAAARMRILTPAQIAEHMRDRFRLLGGGAGGRHASLQAVLDASWELLRPWEQAALAQCAVFEGGFTLEAAEAVLDLGRSRHRPWAVDVVQALFDKSLLRSWVPVSPGRACLATARFGMFASVQDYALRKLMDGHAIRGASGPRAARSAHERHGRWYARLGSEAAIEALDRHEGLQRRHAMEQELENLIAACRRGASRGDGAQGAAHYRAAWAILERRGPLDLAVDLGMTVLRVKLEPVDRARVLDTLGQAEWRSGRLEEARARCDAALAIHRRLRDQRSEGRTLRRLGELLREQGHLEEGRARIEAALEVARGVGDRQTEALALNSLGNSHRDELDASRVRYQEALAIFRAVGDRRWEGAVLSNLGFLHFEQGLVEEARAMMEAALAICRETGDRYLEGVLLGNFGLVNQEAGRKDEARACLDAALALLGETGHRHFEWFYLGALGNLDRDEGRMNEARARLEKAIAMLGEMGSRGNEGILQGFLGDLHLEEGRREEAGRALSRAEALLRGVGDQFFFGRLLCTRARYELQCGAAAAARARINEARVIADRIGAGPDSPLRRDLARLDRALEQAP